VLKIISLLVAILMSAPVFSAPLSQSKIASDGLSLRSKRKVGVGMSAMGAYGVTGVHLELNFTPKISAVTGFGLGNGYQTFNFQLKQVIGGVSFLPYVAAGYARWYTTGDELKRFNETSPEFLGKRFLNSTEKQGRFAENIIYPSAGVQFLKLDGDWAGFSVAAEFLFLIDIDDLVSAPAGSLHVGYFF